MLNKIRNENWIGFWNSEFIGNFVMKSFRKVVEEESNIVLLEGWESVGFEEVKIMGV